MLDKSDQMSDLTEKDFKVAILNKFTEWKASMSEEVKERMMIMSH